VGRKRKERVDAEVRAALAEFAAAVEVRVHAELERSRQTQVALIDAVRGLQAELDNRDQALAHALQRIGQAIDHSSETIDAQRVERRELVETVGKLTRALPPQTPPVDAIAPRILPREHLVGGSVFGATDPVVTVDIDLVAEERRDAREAEAAANDVNGTATRPTDHVEVQCRIEGQWIDGFEVFEIIQDGGLRRYRLRRLSDGVVMPVQYAARDVRRKTVATGARYVRARSPWSRS
jgi:hypothetical protein